MLASYLLVLSLQQSFDCKWVEEVDLLDIRLVIGLVVGASFQLGSLSTEIILGPGTDKTIQLGWKVWDRDLRDDQPLWWICLEYHEAFGR